MGKTLTFARESKNRNAPVYYTYFISGVYFLPYADRFDYVSPTGAGKSGIGFAGGKNDIEKRLKLIDTALQEGHSIGGHANGHFDGKTWSYEQWNLELEQFNNFINNAQESLGIDVLSRIKGFRAPLLAVNQAMYTALDDRGYTYDSSIAMQSPTMPYETGEGMWEFPLAHIAYNGDASRKLIAMDYNFYVRQTNAQDILIKDTPQWNKNYEEVVQSYRDYFNEQYNGERIPIVIVNHFSLWNDGLYWDALKQFIYEVCGKTNVKCVTFEEWMAEK